MSSSKGGQGHTAATYYTLTVPEAVAATIPGALVHKPVKSRQEHIDARRGVHLDRPASLPVEVEREPAPVLSLEERRTSGKHATIVARKHAMTVLNDVVARHPRVRDAAAEVISAADNADSDWWDLRNVMAKYDQAGMPQEVIVEAVVASMVEATHTAMIERREQSLGSLSAEASVVLRGRLSAQWDKRVTR